MMLELLQAPSRQAATLDETAHRPWPLPGGSWIMGQTWEDLLFAHWRVDAAALRRLVPTGLELDEHDGSAWLGVTPFVLSHLRLRGTLPLPLVSSFPEINVRTYVTAGGKPGIWFFSLDTSSRGAVEAARRLYRLPYFHARMSVEHRGGRVHYSSTRRESGRPFVFSGDYAAAGEPFTAEPGSLEEFLTERYCLYARRPDGSLWRNEVHHAPWPLQKAEAGIETNTMLAFHGLHVEGPPALLHYAHRIDVVVWGAERVG